MIITETSNYAYSLLLTAKEGIVHSVYNKTVNLLINGELLALQVKTSPLSPISLITDMNADEFARLDIIKGQQVRLTSGALISITKANEFKINYQESHLKIHDLFLNSTLPEVATDHYLNLFLHVLTHAHTNGFNLIFTSNVDDNLILSVAKNNMEQAKILFANAKWSDSSEMLCKLIGLGGGLTPSGDDFLCGVFAGIKLLHKEEHPFSLTLQKIILPYLQNTNDISRSFLNCAIKNQFSLPVCNLINPKNTAKDIEASFKAIGHSSGIDTLCGIYYTLQLFNE